MLLNALHCVNQLQIMHVWNRYLLRTYHQVPPLPCGTMGNRFHRHTWPVVICSTLLQLTPRFCRSSHNVEQGGLAHREGRRMVGERKGPWDCIFPVAFLTPFHPWCWPQYLLWRVSSSDALYIMCLANGMSCPSYSVKRHLKWMQIDAQISLKWMQVHNCIQRRLNKKFAVRSGIVK